MRSAPWRSGASSGRRKANGTIAVRQASERMSIALWWKIGTTLKACRRAQEIEVAVRDHLAGQIAFALHAEDLVFQVDQAAAVEAQLPEAARAEQQVEVLQAVERVPRAATCGSGSRAAAGRTPCRCR